MVLILSLVFSLFLGIFLWFLINSLKIMLRLNIEALRQLPVYLGTDWKSHLKTRKIAKFKDPNFYGSKNITKTQNRLHKAMKLQLCFSFKMDFLQKVSWGILNIVTFILPKTKISSQAKKLEITPSICQYNVLFSPSIMH